MRILTTTSGWYFNFTPFNHFQQCLLHTFAAYITCDAAVFTLAAFFINLIDINNAALCFFNVLICCLIQSCNCFFYIKTNIAAFSQAGSINDNHGHIQQFCSLLNDISLAYTGGPNKHKVSFVNFHTVDDRIINSFHMRIDCNTQHHLGLILSNHSLIKVFHDSLWCQRSRIRLWRNEFVLQYTVAQFDAFVADINFIAAD